MSHLDLKSKSKFVVGSLLVLSFLFLSLDSASAVGNASFPQDTTLVINSQNYTILGGSDADSVVANSTNAVITVSAGQSITITSANRYRLDNDGGFTTTCTSSLSTLVISAASTTVVTVTPNTGILLCATTGGNQGGGSGGGGGGPAPTPTPTPSPTPSTSVTPTPTPSPGSGLPSVATPASRGFVSLLALSLKEGYTISATGSSDPDIYIANVWGYKRLFLNPAIFNFYGHLGGFANVKRIVAGTRDTLVTSGLYRNCETNDPKVYGVEITGEDTGKLHWVNTSGAQAVADDANFFKKVFCINTKEFNWYAKGTDYTSVNQVPDYSR